MTHVENAIAGWRRGGEGGEQTERVSERVVGWWGKAKRGPLLTPPPCNSLKRGGTFHQHIKTQHAAACKQAKLKLIGIWASPSLANSVEGGKGCEIYLYTHPHRKTKRALGRVSGDRGLSQ